VLAIAYLAVLLAADAGTPAGAAVLPRGRITTVVLTEDVGAPLERAYPNDLYQRAAQADADGRWEDAHALYRRAADEWTAQAVSRPSPGLDLAVAKAEPMVIALLDGRAAVKEIAVPGRLVNFVVERSLKS